MSRSLVVAASRRSRAPARSGSRSIRRIPARATRSPPPGPGRRGSAAAAATRSRCTVQIVRSTRGPIAATRRVRRRAGSCWVSQADIDVESRQRLAELVVQLAGDRRAFLLADGDQPGGQVAGALVRDLDQLLISPQLGHVAMDRDQADGTAVGAEHRRQGDVGPEVSSPSGGRAPSGPSTSRCESLPRRSAATPRPGPAASGKVNGAQRLPSISLGAVAEERLRPLRPERDAAARSVATTDSSTLSSSCA